MDIAAWLASLGLGEYAQSFRANDIDATVLPDLTADDLTALGVTSVGHRRKLLGAIAMVAASSGAQPRSKSRAQAARPRVERRQLTVMFVDLVGSTALSQRLDPEDMRDLIAAYQRAVSDQAARFEGYTAKFMGDGVLVYFGWPRAHEDDAERAVRAGLAAISAVAGFTTPGGDPLAARVGIATSLVIVGDVIGEGSAQEESVVGEAPNLAARLQSLAEPNTVVISSTTQKLVAGLFEMVDLGKSELKGFAAPERIWRIAGEAEVEDRFDARHDSTAEMVGRDAERDLLLALWRQTAAGDGQVVLLSGEPGIGKSRLISAIGERLRARPYTSLRYFCSAYHVNSSFYPVIKHLERATGISRHDTNETKLDKLRALLGQRGTNPAEAVFLLAALLEIDARGGQPLNLGAQAQSARTRMTLTDLLARTATAQPVLMVVEDAHWIDPTTSEWLGGVIDRVRELPVLLIISLRPEFQPSWTPAPHVTQLSLGRLGHEAGATIADRIAGGKSLPSELREQILAKTEGVPLFVEELTKAIIESGQLAEIGDRYVLSRPVPMLAVPSTLQDSLTARLDRLGWTKETAQAGACIGRTFHYRLLAKIADLDEARLRSALQQLEGAGLIFRNGVPPEATYTFKHALIQDTAYEGLLKTRRQRLHAAIAAALDTDFPEVASAEPETLARHCTAAGLAEQAVGHWLRAGQAALKRSANQEATAHLTKGIELVAALPDSNDHKRQELELQRALGLALKATKGFGSIEVLQAFSRARVLSEKLGDKEQLFTALSGQASYNTFAGNLSAADALGHECLTLAQSEGDERLLIEAHHRLWASTFHRGDYVAAEQHIDHVLASYDPDRHHSLTYAYSGHDPGVCSRNHSARLLWFRGYPDQAMRRGYEAVALAERLSHPFSILLAEGSLAEVLLMRREPVEARRRIARWAPNADEFMITALAADAKLLMGWALAIEGHYEEAVEDIREGIAACRAAGSADVQFFLCVLAQACGECSNAREGLALLEEAFAIAASFGSTHRLPEFHRTRGELLLKLGASDSSPENCFRQALNLAAEQRVRALELRAALSLARLYRSRKQDGKARDVLGPIYAWFTEGHTTGDLEEAAALLAQLGR